VRERRDEVGRFENGRDCMRVKPELRWLLRMKVSYPSSPVDQLGDERCPFDALDFRLRRRNVCLQ